MWKEKVQWVRDVLVKHKNVAFPVIIIIAVALTVSVALGAAADRKLEQILPESVEEPDSQEVEEIGEVPLVLNQDSAVEELILNFYNAQANGDLETLALLCDNLSDLDKLSFEEKAKYIEYYPTIEIYTKKGFRPGETIAFVYYHMCFLNHEEEFPGYTSHYVCTAEDNSLYIKRNNFSEEMNEYFAKVCSQNDIIEFDSRVRAEYDAFVAEYPELATYPEEVVAQVNTTVGDRWSKEHSEDSKPADGEEEPDEDSESPEEPAETVPVYAKTTATVNVRASDSEQADRLGKATGGSRLEVLEQRVNGWTKVLYEGKEGYIKSEYLRLEENVANVETIGTIQATTNINVRTAASTSADSLGVLAGGDTAKLVAEEGDWSKIIYNGQIAYVKSEYVRKQ